MLTRGPRLLPAPFPDGRGRGSRWSADGPLSVIRRPRRLRGTSRRPLISRVLRPGAQPGTSAFGVSRPDAGRDVFRHRGRGASRPGVSRGHSTTGPRGGQPIACRVPSGDGNVNGFYRTVYWRATGYRAATATIVLLCVIEKALKDPTHDHVVNGFRLQRRKDGRAWFSVCATT